MKMKEELNGLFFSFCHGIPKVREMLSMSEILYGKPSSSWEELEHAFVSLIENFMSSLNSLTRSSGSKLLLYQILPPLR